jgi:hypothetical protein
MRASILRFIMIAHFTENCIYVRHQNYEGKNEGMINRQLIGHCSMLITFILDRTLE